MNIIEASAGGDLDKVKELIAAGIRLNDKDKDGWTALHWASYWDLLEIVQELIAAGRM